MDLFFVISGFLITSILHHAPQISRAFIVDFYNRRIKRIMPAFVLVAVATTAATSGLLLAEDFVLYLKSVRESFVFRSNLFFERETTGYFALNSAELPWLHTWSLSVEWQFYLLFPAVFWLLRYLPGKYFQARAFLLFTLLTLLALAASILLVMQEPAHAYFSTLARFFEFLMGGLAVFIKAPPVGRATSKIISGLCVAGLIFLATHFLKQTSFPGWNALGVCMLALLAIVFGGNDSLLSRSGLAHIGKLSYSAYLWHWPVIALLNYLQHQPQPTELVMWIGLVFVLSEVTYRWVERPGIASQSRLPLTFVLWCLLPALMAASLYLVVRNHQGFPQRLGPEARQVYLNLERYKYLAGDKCHDFKSPDIEACAFGDLRGRENALLIGDSHARHYRPFVQILAEPAHLKVYGLTNSECLSLTGVVLPDRYTSPKACAEATERYFKLIREGRFRYVMLAERWAAYPEEQLVKLEDSVRTIIEAGAIPVLFKSIAENGESTKDCFYRHIKLRQRASDDCSIPVNHPFEAQPRRDVNRLIDQIKARHPSVIVIDPKAVQCDQAACATVIDGTPIYTDTHHLSEFGSVRLAQRYLARFGNPLQP